MILQFIITKAKYNKKGNFSLEKEDTMHNTRKMMGYNLMTFVIILCWAVSMPTWSWMFKTFLNVSQPERHVELAMILFPFYVTFMFGELMTSVLLGLGETK